MNRLWTNPINKVLGLLILSVALTAAPAMYRNSFAQPAPTKDTKTTKSTSAKSTDATPAPSDKEIADAKSKGMVWVNLSSGVYHKEGKFYGKTKKGKFMSEDDAKKAGYHEAKTGAASKTTSKTSSTTKK
jgi:hypothetical protein